MERENFYNQNATFFNPNWDNSMDQNDPFESALSSMVSSPGTSNIAITPSNENFVLRELIGRLGSICNSAEVSPHSYINGNTSTSTNTSCYTTPLNSPPKLHLSPMDHQIRGNSLFPGNNLPPLSFPERRFSNFPNSEVNNSGKLSKIQVSGSQMNVQENSRLSRSSTPEKAENSSVSEQIPVNVQTDTNSRKRKSISKGKAKDIPSSTRKDANAEAENNEETAKRTKSDDQITPNNSAGEVKKDNEKPPESPKDYIHVRARRGQATDAHSLAERVRREKISQRMQLLQDLVPGCNKVTGKAVMLDEIINYVQSLQRQVEFLSMKLATINPRMDVNLEALLSKDMFQSRGGYASDISSSAYPFVFQSQSLIPNGTYNEGAPQVSTSFWEDDLQSVVFGQNQAQNFHDGSVNLSTSQMKVEL